MMSCVTPRHKAGNASFGMILFNSRVIPFNVTFVFFETPFLLEIFPSRVPIFGAQMISLYGFFPHSYNQWKCMFGQQFTHLFLISSSIGRCFVPVTRHIGLSNVSLQYGFHASSYAVNPIHLEIFEDTSILGIFPSSGPLHGGTVVTVTGRSILSTSVCRFGKKEGIAFKYVTSTSCACVSPAHHESIVQISVFSESFGSHGASLFEYHNSFSLRSVFPTSGSKLGGYPISLYGNFPNAFGVMCRFGERTVEFHRINQTHGLCMVPGNSSGMVQCTLVQNSQSLETSIFAFLYLTDEFDWELFPKYAFNSGGSSLYVVSKGMKLDIELSSNIFCKFDGKSVRSLWVNSTSVSCIFPEQNSPSDVQFELLLEDISLFRTHLTVLQVPVLFDVFPKNAPRSGGTKLQILGTHFVRNYWKCSFAVNTWNNTEIIYMTGTFVSSTSLICLSPRTTFAISEFRLIFLDHNILSDGKLFHHWLPLREVLLEPTQIPVGTASTVTLSGSASWDANLWVKFGQQTAKILTQRYDNNTLAIQCELEPVEILSNVSLFVSYNNVDFVMTSARLSIASSKRMKNESSIEILKFQPSVGFLHESTEVFVYGQNFLNTSLVCQFGSHEVSASITNHTSAICHTPILKVSTQVEVRLKENSSNLIVSGGIFQFIGRPRIDQIIPHRTHTSVNTITVVGVGLSSPLLTMKCQVGGYAAHEGSIITSTMLGCTAGPLLVGENTIRLYWREFPAQVMEHVMYFENTYVLSIFPSHANVLGGSFVTVLGNQFQVDSNYTCYFGSFRSIAKYVNLTQIECIVPEGTEGSVSFRVIDGETYLHQTKLTFEYLSEDYKILSLQPSLGFSTRTSSLLLKLSKSISKFETISCIIQADHVKAISVQDDTIECVTLNPVEGIFEVSVTMDHMFSSNSFKFIVRKSPTVWNIHPKVVKSFRPTNITVTGASFDVSSHRCLAASTYTMMTVMLSSTMLVCRSLSIREGNHSLQVYFRMPSLAPNVVENEFASQAFTVSSVTGHRMRLVPSSGTSAGGDVVSVFLEVDQHDLHIQLDNRVMPCERMSPFLLVCITPKHSAGIVPVKIYSFSSYKYGFALGTLEFQFLHFKARITSLNPSIACANEHSTISVYGSFFENQGKCKLGQTFVPTRFITSSVLECKVPYSLPLIQTLEYGLNENDFTSDGLLIEFSSISTIDVTPSVFVMNADPQQIVTIRGSNFPSMGLSLCSFQGRTRSTEILSSTSAKCAIHILSAGNYSLIIAYHDQKCTLTAPIQVVTAPIRIYPTIGPVSGGTKVMISYDPNIHFHLKCRSFHLVEKPTSSQIHCLTPRKRNEQKLSLKQILGMDIPMDLTNISFLYVQTPIVKAIIPSKINYQETKLIQVEGEHFRVDSMWCRVGTQVTAAKTASSTLLHCSTSAKQEELRVYVEVSLNGVDFTQDEKVLTFFEAPEVQRIEPSAGPASGETTVTLIGRGFETDAEISCVFGEDSVSTKGRWIGWNMMSCVTP
eukprot:764393-Hanusia_phi.AAC.1